MKNPVGWFEIYVNDITRAKQFYEAVFNIQLSELTPPSEGNSLQMWAFPSDMQVYGASGALVQMSGVAAGGNSTLIYFSCEDCADEAARIGEAGGKIHESKTSIGEYGFIVLAFDTEGNMIGLHSMK
ncbi:VOC family protein [Acinetobacter tandoii]|jgi:predicted enzyme related to lactoylglutathione lyase|uniref:VOC family protein n=1 Tax=Acinetobacter tandoii TaxID=202954 RepID=A0A5N4WI36_9GAMM|nr:MULTISPECIES: VOC family protein [Acinetobacter]ELN4659154.1 VOC family protein [Escherichia coli]KAB1858097.1 VOC family protein [Acinetobacter tandoii]UOG16745.1 VOC family protein [Acinetobacter sp. PK01]